MSQTVLRLLQAAWLQQGDVQTIFRLLDGQLGRTRAVGGIVRDTILDRLNGRTDIDLATELLPGEVMARAAAAGVAHYPTGIAHGTVTLRLGATSLEVTTLRRDIETDGRHAVVQFGTDWSLDAGRRDFTMNALYAGMDGAMFDPLGGLTDCLSQRVRFIGDPATRIAEDGLRVFRFFRFSASHGQQVFDEPGLTACAAAVGHLGRLSAERVGGEMVRMLSLPRIANTLGQMERTGLVTLGSEAIAALTAYERQAGEGVLPARLAILLGCGDPARLQETWRLGNAAMAKACDIRAAADLLVTLAVAETAYRYPRILDLALDVAAAETGWGEASKAALSEQLDGVAASPMPISGRDLITIGFRAGPDLGAALAAAEKRWIDSGFSLRPEQLLAEAKRQAGDALRLI